MCWTGSSAGFVSGNDVDCYSLLVRESSVSSVFGNSNEQSSSNEKRTEEYALQKKTTLYRTLIQPKANICLTRSTIFRLSLSLYQLEQFMSYLTLLDKWNRHINLTGLRSCREIILKHFLDSLTPIPYLPEEARLLDLGSGAGFPGLPIKIVRPNQPVTLIEASAKKVSFLKEAVRHLALRPHFQSIRAIWGKGPPHLLETDSFEIIITRAVGNLINLLTAADSLLDLRGEVIIDERPAKGLKRFSV